MSTIKVTNLQDTSGGNSSTSEEIFQGRAKAWINFNGTGTVAIRDEFNISSITDNGTGLYTVNFTTAMANANYAVVPGGTRELPENSRCFPANIDQIGTSLFDLSTHNDGSTSVDWEHVLSLIHI